MYIADDPSARYYLVEFGWPPSSSGAIKLLVLHPFLSFLMRSRPKMIAHVLNNQNICVPTAATFHVFSALVRILLTEGS